MSSKENPQSTFDLSGIVQEAIQKEDPETAKKIIEGWGHDSGTLNPKIEPSVNSSHPSLRLTN